MPSPVDAFATSFAPAGREAESGVEDAAAAALGVISAGRTRHYLPALPWATSTGVTAVAATALSVAGAGPEIRYAHRRRSGRGSRRRSARCATRRGCARRARRGESFSALWALSLDKSEVGKQVVAEALSRRKATRPTTRRATGRGPISSRVDTMIDKYALFTRVRRRGILRTSFARSCIDRPPRDARMASKTLHTSWRRSTSCGLGWICSQTNDPAIAITLAAVLCTPLPLACPKI